MSHRRRHIEQQILLARENLTKLAAAKLPRASAVSMFRKMFGRVTARMRRVVLGVPVRGTGEEYAEAMRTAVRAALDEIADGAKAE